MLSQQVEIFSKEYALTNREAEVLKELLQNAQKLKELSDILKVSPNTINNHIKKILKKTETHSKSELISKFLLFVVKENNDAFEKAKKPRVLVIDDEEDFCDVLSSQLKEKNLDAYGLYSSENIFKEIDEFYPDIIICDVRMPKVDGVGILKKLREKSSCYPIVIFMSGYSDYLIEELLDFGCVDLINKPFSIEELHELIMKHIIGYGIQKEDKLSHPENEENQDHVELERVTIGFGGLFASFEDNLKLSKDLGLGDSLRVSFSIPEHKGSIIAKAEVVWKRLNDKPAFKSGVGIRFTLLGEEELAAIKIHAKNKNILSYVPIGNYQQL